MHSHGVNKDLVLSRINEIRMALEEAEGILSKGFDQLSSTEKLALRYIIIQLVEAAASICIHILREVKGIYADSYPGCFKLMGGEGLIPAGLARNLVAAARLRNLLVHRYWEIDDRLVYESARSGSRDFEEFARLMEAMVYA